MRDKREEVITHTFVHHISQCTQYVRVEYMVGPNTNTHTQVQQITGFYPFSEVDPLIPCFEQFLNDGVR